MIQPADKPLSVGETAPHFRAEDLFGSIIDLNDYTGKRLLLAFFRNAACALCNLRVHELIQHYPDLHNHGLHILAVFESPRENLLQYVGKQDAPFPIIPDPEAWLYTLYGVETSEAKVQASMQHPATQGRVQTAASAGFHLTPEAGSNFNRIPAEFLIDSDGRIRHAFYANIVGDHLSIETLAAFANGTAM